MTRSGGPLELTDREQEFATLARTILAAKNIPITQIRGQYAEASGTGSEVRIVVDGVGTYEERCARVLEARAALETFFIDNPKHKFANPYKQPLYSVRHAVERSPAALAP